MLYFYPRSPCGERLNDAINGCNPDFISIHALLAESDLMNGKRRAIILHFYPRSPCGERQCLVRGQRPSWGISIHALLAESDRSARPETRRSYAISIHALLAESDAVTTLGAGSVKDFYPRSPCGERPSGGHIRQTRSKHFYPRSPCGERHSQNFATLHNILISIHALLAESDVMDALKLANAMLFLSTLSLRRATFRWGLMGGLSYISIHALLAESDQPPRFLLS